MVNPATLPLTEDERMILQILEASPEPLDRFTVTSNISPPPEIRDGRRRESRLWRERQSKLTDALLALWQAGFIFEAVPADGWNADRFAVTDAGCMALVANARNGSNSDA
jgi:hypothetical protein